MAGTTEPTTDSARPGKQALFPGDSEMARRMREFDWSKTLVGPVETWPQSLKTAVSICLGSRYPIVIWWDKQALTQFYNDAYISFLGATKHPGALGQSGRECWSEIWPVMGPMWEGVFATGEATWSEDFLYVIDRNLPREEGYFTFSYSPIWEETGKVGGIFCACYETTGRVIGERRLRTLQDLGRTVMQAKAAEEACEVTARMLAANSADISFALIYLLDDDARHARLVATSGLQPGSGAAPQRIDLSERAKQSATWPLRRVLSTAATELVSDIAARFGPLPGGPWPESPEAALVLPIANRGQAQATGFLVAGLSPRRVVDSDYRSFFDLIAGHLATAIANARAYEEERRRAEALAELDRAKTAFFSNVSHEFRTPLTLMLAPVEDLLSRSHMDLSPAAKEQLELVNRNGYRLLRLVNTLLDFSRIEAGRIQASYEPIDLARFTSELASVFRAATERAGLRLIVDCDALSEPVFVDRDMWEKIVLNLLSNALKFTFEGEIAIYLKQTDTQAELRVRDTGVGIPAEEMPHLFERFHRIETARSRTHEGSGIGLALVQELVKLHSGTVRAESILGEGATFIVSIPLGAAHLPAERIGAQRSLASTATGALPFVEEALRWLPDENDEGGRMKDESERFGLQPSSSISHPSNVSGPSEPRPCVIVADDNADMRQYLARLLSERYDIVAVPDGEAALAATHERRPDLILSDVMMPRRDGFDLVKEIRAGDVTRSIPVILLTARAGDESRVEGLDIGADDYLVKPFSARELLARVESCLKLSRLRRESEGRITAILESIADGFQVVDAGWRFTYMNPAARRMLAAQGMDVDALVGKHLWDEAFPGARGSLLERELTRAMIERVPVAFENFYEPWRRWYAVRAYPVDQGGLAIYFLDITERRRHEEALRESEAQLAADLADSQQLQMIQAADLIERKRAEKALKETDRRKDEFLAMLGHELRNPLGVISAVTQLTRRKLPADGELEELQDAMGRQVKQMARLLDDLLDVSRIGRGQIRLKKEPCDFTAIVREATKDHQSLLEGSGLHLVTELADGPLWIMGDRARLAQIVGNALYNATKFTDPGGSVTVRLANAEDGKTAVLTIRDTGIGMEPATLAHAFEPFIQAEHSIDRSRGGLGLGLALVKGLVELQGGKVAISSEGRGHGVELMVRSRLPRPRRKKLSRLLLRMKARARSAS